jgi:ankyrin repeat protein
MNKLFYSAAVYLMSMNLFGAEFCHHKDYDESEPLIARGSLKTYGVFDIQPQEDLVALMFKAIAHHDSKEVTKLLELGLVDPNASHNTKGSLLTAAALRGNLKIVRILCKFGADVNKSVIATISYSTVHTKTHELSPLLAAKLALAGNYNEIEDLLVSLGAVIPKSQNEFIPNRYAQSSLRFLRQL